MSGFSTPPPPDRSPAWARARADGAVLVVRATPRGGGDRIEGVGVDAAGRPHLCVRVRVAPEGGAANAAVEALIAAGLAIPRSRVRVVQGRQARLKTVFVEGATPAALVRLAPGKEEADA